MKKSINICTLNCRGLRDKRKRRDLFKYLKEMQYSVCCLQDVHWDNKWSKMIRAEWGYECFFAGFTTNSRGVAIVFNNNFEFKGCFTIRVHFQKLHSSPVLSIKAYFDFKVLLPKHRSGLGLPTAIKRRLESINFSKKYAHS